MKAEVVERREIFDGGFMRLEVERVRLPNGRTAELALVRHCGAVAVVPVTAEGEVILVRQYRHATGEWLLEVPAGKLDPDEAPDECVARELEEETGFRAGSIESLGPIWVTPGFCDERIWLYLATELEPGTQALEPDEILTPVRMPWQEAIAAAHDGRIQDGKTICALLRAAAAVSEASDRDRLPAGR